MKILYAGGVEGDVQVEVIKNYNGSGKSAFGGANEWPVVKVHIPFMAGANAEAAAFAEKLQSWLEAQAKL